MNLENYKNINNSHKSYQLIDSKKGTIILDKDFKNDKTAIKYIEKLYNGNVAQGLYIESADCDFNTSIIKKY
jgi:hypothetical protein